MKKYESMKERGTLVAEIEKQDINNKLSETYPEGSLAADCWYCWHGRSLDHHLQSFNFKIASILI